MTYGQYLKRVDRINRRIKQARMRQSLRDKKQRHKRAHKKIETNKIIAVYLFVLLNAIVVYAMIAMWRFNDLSYLGALISDIAAQVVIYAIYCAKAYAGKKAEENLKFEREKWLSERDNSEGPVCEEEST